MSRSLQRDRRSYLSALCRAVPYHIVERVLQNPSELSLDTQTFDGSVLVIDLVGFTPMCERLALSGASGLSDLHLLLGKFFERLELQSIFPYQGYIVQFAGDAVSVVFRGNDHARRCAASALTIRNLMRDRKPEEIIGAQGRDLMVRMGIAIGQVRLQVLGDITRRLPLCAGEAIHRAIRLQHEAEPGEILAEPGLWECLGGELKVRDRGDDRLVPVDLLHWPDKQPIQSLEDRILERVEEKISLLEPFVPEPLARRMRTTLKGWHLQGEIRRATILFADFTGFEEAPENLPLARDLARSVLRAFRKYDGVVLNVASTVHGHRVLLLFGLHKPSENDTERALLAALESIGRVMAFVKPAATNLRSRIGVHSGDVYLGSIGSSHKYDLTAVGDAVNVAARVAMSAKPFEVLVTHDTLGGTEKEFNLTEQRPIQVKGKQEPQPVHVVHGLANGRAHYVQRRTKDRFLAGRKEALAKLHRIVEASLAGKAHIIGITGESGTGKSALLSMLVDRWVDGGGIGIIGHCRFATRSSPLAPLADMFSTYFGFTEADSDERRAELIRQGLGDMDLGDGLREMISLLQPVRRPDRLVEALVDLAERREQEKVIEVILQFIDQRVQQQKVLYVLEDIHYADTLTLQVARRILSLSRDRSYLFLVTCRPDDTLADIRKQLDHEIHLTNLNLQESSDLICHQTRAKEVDSSLADFLHRRSAGNPEHLIQTLGFLSDRFLVTTHDDKVVASEPGVEMLEDVVPGSWSHVALARLEGLGEVERHILRTASAIGRQFDTWILNMASGNALDPEILDTVVNVLQAQQVITTEQAEPAGPERQYRFRDDVTRAIAYSMIPEAERRVIHSRIADALEPEDPESTQAVAAAIAHHRDRASQWAQAAGWYERVARLAAITGMNREACYFAERWKQVVDKLPEDKRPGRESSARVALARLVATSRQRLVRTAFSQARRMLQAYSDRLEPRPRSIVNLILAEAQLFLGRLAEAGERFQKVYDSVSEDGPRFEAACQISHVYRLRWEFTRATEWLDRAQSLAGQDERRLLRVRLARAEMFIESGKLDHASGLLWEAFQSRSGQGPTTMQSACLRGLGRHAILAEDFQGAREHLHQARQLDQRTAKRQDEASDRLLLGWGDLRSHRQEEARPHLEAALGMAREMGDELVRTEALVHLGICLAHTEDPAEGMRMFHEGYALARRYGLAGVEREANMSLLAFAMTVEDAELFDRALERCLQYPAEYAAPIHNRILGEATRLRP